MDVPVISYMQLRTHNICDGGARLFWDVAGRRIEVTRRNVDKFLYVADWDWLAYNLLDTESYALYVKKASIYHVTGDAFLECYTRVWSEKPWWRKLAIKVL